MLQKFFKNTFSKCGKVTESENADKHLLNMYIQCIIVLGSCTIVRLTTAGGTLHYAIWQNSFFPLIYGGIYHIEVRCSKNTPASDLFPACSRQHNSASLFVNKQAYV